MAPPRFQVETLKTDAFLHRMLPPPVVAQMKHDLQVADEFEERQVVQVDLTDVPAARWGTEYPHIYVRKWAAWRERAKPPA